MLHAALLGSNYVIADDSDVKAKRQRYCCQRAASSTQQYTHALCCPDLPLATPSCPFASGTVPARPPAEALDAFHPADECGRSLSQPAEHIPDTELPASSCCRNRCPAFHRRNSSHLSPPYRTARNPSAKVFRSGMAWALSHTPPQPGPK